MKWRLVIACTVEVEAKTEREARGKFTEAWIDGDLDENLHHLVYEIPRQ